MPLLLAAGVLAQGADALTMRFSHEANPLVLDLGPLAYLAKIALILGVTFLSWSLPRLRTRSRRRLRQAASTSLALSLLAVGTVGATSNLLASM